MDGPSTSGGFGTSSTAETSRWPAEMSKRHVLKQYRIGKRNGRNVRNRCPASWTAEMIEYYTKVDRSKRYFDCVKVLAKIREKTDTNESDWTVSAIDSAGPSRSVGLPPKCTVCGRFGHTAEICRKRKRREVCVMCGTEEGHDMNACDKSVCLSCGTARQGFSDSCEHCESLRRCHCTVCNETGHKPKSCPENWRRFHDITSPEPEKEEISKAVDPQVPSASGARTDETRRDESKTATVVSADRIESNGAGRAKRSRISMNFD